MHLSCFLFVDELKIRMQPSCILQLCGASCAEPCQSAQKTFSFVCNREETLQACTILVTSTKHSGTVAAGQPASEATQPGCVIHTDWSKPKCVKTSHWQISLFTSCAGRDLARPMRDMAKKPVFSFLPLKPSLCLLPSFFFPFSLPSFLSSLQTISTSSRPLLPLPRAHDHEAE